MVSDAKVEVAKVAAALRMMGIDVREDEVGALTFEGMDGTCRVSASQTYDGVVYVRHTVADHARTADDVLRLCGIGVMEEQR
jgi:hypothetical protein